MFEDKIERVLTWLVGENPKVLLLKSIMTLQVYDVWYISDKNLEFFEIFITKFKFS